MSNQKMSEFEAKAKTYKFLADLFKTLANPTRLKILALLSGKGEGAKESRGKECLGKIPPTTVKIALKTVKWDQEEKGKLAQLKRWVDSKGGVLALGQGSCEIIFTLPEDEGFKS